MLQELFSRSRLARNNRIGPTIDHTTVLLDSVVIKAFAALQGEAK